MKMTVLRDRRGKITVDTRIGDIDWPSVRIACILDTNGYWNQPIQYLLDNYKPTKWKNFGRKSRKDLEDFLQANGIQIPREQRKYKCIICPNCQAEFPQQKAKTVTKVGDPQRP